MKLFKRVLLGMTCLVAGMWLAQGSASASQVGDVSQNYSTWMQKYVPDNQKVGDLSIPGTHDSAAYKMRGISMFAAFWAKTQDWSITSQLNNGVRFLDLRVCEDFTMHHGVAWVGETFPYHLKEICQFLDKNPGEFVFVRIKDEESRPNLAYFKRKVDDYITSQGLGKYFATNLSRSTTAKDLRGKIVLLDDTETSLGYAAANWRTTAQQDAYSPGGFDQKWHWIVEGIKTKNSDNYQGRLYVNHLSYTDGAKRIRNLADAMNKQFSQYLTSVPKDQSLGVTVMDFPTNTLINQIISQNIK